MDLKTKHRLKQELARAQRLRRKARLKERLMAYAEKT